MARLAAQARAVAVRAELRVAKLGELLAHHQRLGLAIAPLEVRQHALEGVLAHLAAAALGDVAESDLLLARAVQDELLRRRVEHLPGRFGVEAVARGER